jgi:hypothetical protein
LLDRDAGLLPDSFRGTGQAGRLQALAELRGVGGAHLQGCGQQLGVTAADDVAGHGGQQVAGLPGTARPEVDPGQ